MKKAGFLALALVLLAAVFPVAAQAAPGDVRIEQVQIELPEAQAYFYVEGGTDEVPQVTARLGDDTLAVEEVRRYNPARDATHYLFLVDCSTSISPQQMDGVKAALTTFAEDLQPDETVSLLAFGVEVETLLLRSADGAEIARAVAGLQPDKEGTVFLNAMAQAIELTSNQAFAMERALCFVFSDSIDYNVGGYTTQEVEEMIAATGVPFYALGFDTGTKEALDTFGQLARTSGGAIHIVDAQTVGNTFESALRQTRQVWVATLRASSNVVAAPVQSFALATPSGNEGQIQVPVRFWVPDETAPTVVEVAQITDESIRIVFSEAVQGADVTGSYTVRQNDDLLELRAVAYDDAQFASVLTFSSPPPSGQLTIDFPGITDVSMEKNRVAQAAGLPFGGAAPPPPEETEDNTLAVVLWFLVPILCITVVAIVAITLSRRRKSRASAPQAPEARPDAAAPQPDPKTGLPTVRLVVQNLQGEKQTIEQPIDHVLFVGRSAACDIRFDDPALAEQHFTIELHNGHFTLTNLSGRETLVNDVPAGEAHPLKTGDIIAAGRQVMVFHHSNSAPHPQ